MVARLEPGQVVAGRYRIEGLLGEGGMGVVYRARHIHTDEALAMKVLHPHVLRDASAVERFRREARAPARIASEHVARVTDADTAPDLDDAPFYVMELLHGVDLERLVEQQGPLAPHVVVELLRQAARALDKAHAMGIVHRDLKPENLFLTHREDGSPWLKLLDFGIARLASEASDQKKTQAGYIFGTPAYMAPEQAVGDVDRIGPATDVWALGLVAFKLLTGQEFWGDKTAGQHIALIVSGSVPAPSSRGASFGPAFDAWFAHCLMSDPAHRFASAGEAIAALGQALSIEPVPSVAPPSIDVSRVTAPPPRMQSSPSHARTSSGSTISLAQPSARSSSMWILAGLAGLGALGIFVVMALVVTRHLAGSDPSALASAAPPQAPSPHASPLAASDASIDAPSTTAEDDASAPAVATEPEAPKVAPKEPPPRALTRSQLQRLGVLQRLCAQGTFTPDECRTKQSAILREP